MTLLENISKWITSDTAIIAASLTAIIAFISKVFELVILWRNKKKEIDYSNEAAIKEGIRSQTTEIISSANTIAVGINSYIDLLDKSLQIMNGRQSLTGHHDLINEDLENKRQSKINQINQSSLEIVSQLIQFQLYFADTKLEHEAVKQANKLQEITVEFKNTLFGIQEDFNVESFENGKVKLEELTKKLNTSIDEFSISVRKSLRTYRYKVHGGVRLTDWTEQFRSKYRSWKKIMIQFLIFFTGIIGGIAILKEGWNILSTRVMISLIVFLVLVILINMIIRENGKSSEN